MSKSCVYMHICPNSKVYIGQAIDPVSRWNNGNGYINNKEFYSDIKNMDGTILVMKYYLTI